MTGKGKLDEICIPRNRRFFFWTGVFDDDIRLNIRKAELKIKRQLIFLLQSATSFLSSKHRDVFMGSATDEKTSSKATIK